MMTAAKSTIGADVAAEERRSLLSATIISTLLFALAFFLIKHGSWLPTRAQVEAPTLEAELIPAAPAPAQLHEAKPAKIQAVVHEKAVSTQVSTKTEAATAKPAPTDVQNQTVSGAPPQQLTHGPQVESAPPPKLPSGLKDQNLKTSVLIEFFISAAGVATPSLIGSSGNDEVDALAVRAAQKWTFRPAMKDGKPIDAKVRLRINFDVE